MTRIYLLTHWGDSGCSEIRGAFDSAEEARAELPVEVITVGGRMTDPLRCFTRAHDDECCEVEEVWTRKPIIATELPEPKADPADGALIPAAIDEAIYNTILLPHWMWAPFRIPLKERK